MTSVSYTMSTAIEDHRFWSVSRISATGKPEQSFQMRAARQRETDQICLDVEASQLRTPEEITEFLILVRDAMVWLGLATGPSPQGQVSEPPGDPEPTIVMPRGVLSHIDTGPHFLGQLLAEQPEWEPEPYSPPAEPDGHDQTPPPPPPPPAPPVQPNPSHPSSGGRPPSLLGPYDWDQTFEDPQWPEAPPNWLKRVMTGLQKWISSTNGESLSYAS